MSHQQRATLLGDWHRYHPQAHRIADELLAQRDLLNLRTRRLAADIRARFGVGDCTARTAVAIARKAA
jgi:hypothetical protein